MEPDFFKDLKAFKFVDDVLVIEKPKGGEYPKIEIIFSAEPSEKNWASIWEIIIKYEFPSKNCKDLPPIKIWGKYQKIAEFNEAGKKTTNKKRKPPFQMRVI